MRRHARAAAAIRGTVARTPEVDAITGELCTLDGKPARIIGARLRFATVAQYPDGLEVEYAWGTAARILARGGDFQS